MLQRNRYTPITSVLRTSTTRCKTRATMKTKKGITITQKQATIAMGGVSVLALIWLLSHIFWMTLGTSGFLCGVHALFRDASMHKDEEDRVAMQGDLSLDDEAAFLNNSGPSLA